MHWQRPLLTIFVWSLAVCGVNAQSRIEWQPMPERIPHYADKHILISKNGAVPADYEFHRSVIRGYDGMRKTKMDLVTEGH